MLPLNFGYNDVMHTAAIVWHFFSRMKQKKTTQFTSFTEHFLDTFALHFYCRRPLTVGLTRLE